MAVQKQKYMLIDVTSPEETKILKITDNVRAVLWGHLYKAEGKTVIAPPLLGRGFGKIDRLGMKYVYWQLFSTTPPDDYQEAIEKCLNKLIFLNASDETHGNLVDDVSEENLIRRCSKVGIDLAGNPYVKSEEKEAKIKARASGIPGRPKATTTTGLVWEVCDRLLEELGEIPNRQQAIEACGKEEINPATASTQYAKWKKSKQASTSITEEG